MITWAYIAGFLDGDGWITKSNLKSGRPVYLAGLTQVATRRNEMIKIHNFLLSHDIRSKFKLRNKHNWKSSLKMVNITVKEQKSILKFLSKIKPYLLIKKPMADEVVNYVKSRIKIRNIKAFISNNKKMKWTNVEVNLLKSLAAVGMSNIEISQKLHRGTTSICRKIHRLNIHRKIYVKR